jgi:Helix-turn-helix domain
MLQLFMGGSRRELPGFLTVAGASDRLALAPRSVRDLIYAGRLPSARLGRRHYLRVADIEAERRRRLGLPLPAQRDQPRAARRATRPAPPESGSIRAPQRRVDTNARRQRATQRALLFQRWLRSGHRPEAPLLPFTLLSVAAAATCGACGRVVRPGSRVVDAQSVDGRDATRLCLTCARRALLVWADERRREAVAARNLARVLGTISPTNSPPGTIAA